MNTNIESIISFVTAQMDGEAARADMRQQCMELPPDMQRDLQEHFKGKPAVGLIQQKENTR